MPIASDPGRSDGGAGESHGRGGELAWGSLRRALPWLVCSALSGLLIFLSFPPVDLGPLAFVAFVPLLVSVGRVRSYGWAALCATVAAAFAYLPAFAWVASVAAPGCVGLAFYVGLYLVAAALAVRFLQRNCGGLWPMLAALVWVAVELLRARLGPGFPWLLLGYTQYRFGSLLQMAAIGGVYAVSFIVFLVDAGAAALALTIVRRPARRPRGLPVRPCAMLGAALLLLAAASAHGAAVRRRVSVEKGPVIGVIQQNIPRLVQEIYAVPETPEQERDQIDRVYREMADELQRAAQLTARLRGKDVRLVVWPETTVQVPLNVAPDLLVPRGRNMVRAALGYLESLGAEMGSFFLVGAPTYYPREAGYVMDLRYGTDVTGYGNSALLFSPQGKLVERYDKMRLVPFGEYIPLRDALPFLKLFTPISREITRGTAEVIFTLPRPTADGATQFSALICYEDVFADLTRSFRRKGARFLVNLTDEGWYYIPGELRQHLAMAVFRAVETRTTVVRAANTGISCFIGPRGDVYAELEPHVEGALSAPVQLCQSVAVYVKHGDWFAITCLVLAAGLPPLLVVLRRPAQAGALSRSSTAA